MNTKNSIIPNISPNKEKSKKEKRVISPVSQCTILYNFV